MHVPYTVESRFNDMQGSVKTILSLNQDIAIAEFSKEQYCGKKLIKILLYQDKADSCLFTAFYLNKTICN